MEYGLGDEQSDLVRKLTRHDSEPVPPFSVPEKIPNRFARYVLEFVGLFWILAISANFDSVSVLVLNDLSSSAAAAAHSRLLPLL